MRITKTEIMGSFDRKDEIKAAKKIANNTVQIYLTDGTMIIRHFYTNIVTRTTGGIYKLDDGGWRSVTTKQRLNEYTPFSIYQEKHEWFVCTTKIKNIPFHRGIKFHTEGYLLVEQAA